MLLECRSHLLGVTVSWSDPTRLVSRLARVLVQCHVHFCADRAAGRTEPTATICCPPPASLEMKTRWEFLLETGRLCPSQWAHGSVFRKQHLEFEHEKAKETSEGRRPAVATGSSVRTITGPEQQLQKQTQRGPQTPVAGPPTSRAPTSPGSLLPLPPLTWPATSASFTGQHPLL